MTHHVGFQSRPEEMPKYLIICLCDPQMSSSKVIMGERKYLRSVRRWDHNLGSTPVLIT